MQSGTSFVQVATSLLFSACWRQEYIVFLRSMIHNIVHCYLAMLLNGNGTLWHFWYRNTHTRN